VSEELVSASIEDVVCVDCVELYTVIGMKSGSSLVEIGSSKSDVFRISSLVVELGCCTRLDVVSNGNGSLVVTVSSGSRLSDTKVVELISAACSDAVVPVDCIELVDVVRDSSGSPLVKAGRSVSDALGISSLAMKLEVARTEEAVIIGGTSSLVVVASGSRSDGANIVEVMSGNSSEVFVSSDSDVVELGIPVVVVAEIEAALATRVVEVSFGGSSNGIDTVEATSGISVDVLCAADKMEDNVNSSSVNIPEEKIEEKSTELSLVIKKPVCLVVETDVSSKVVVAGESTVVMLCSSFVDVMDCVAAELSMEATSVTNQEAVVSVDIVSCKVVFACNSVVVNLDPSLLLLNPDVKIEISDSPALVVIDKNSVSVEAGSSPKVVVRGR